MTSRYDLRCYECKTDKPQWGVYTFEERKQQEGRGLCDSCFKKDLSGIYVKLGGFNSCGYPQTVKIHENNTMLFNPKKRDINNTRFEFNGLGYRIRCYVEGRK